MELFNRRVNFNLIAVAKACAKLSIATLTASTVGLSTLALADDESDVMAIN